MFIFNLIIVMKVISTKMIFMDMGYINGQMGENIEDNGKIIKWMEMVHLHGLMEENIQEM